MPPEKHSDMIAKTALNIKLASFFRFRFSAPGTRPSQPATPPDQIHCQIGLKTVKLPNSGLAAIALLLSLAAPLPAQDLKAFEKRVTEFTLPNGLHFIVLERHDAPVVSFHTYVNVGSVDDPKGKTYTLEMAILDYDLDEL